MIAFLEISVRPELHTNTHVHKDLILLCTRIQGLGLINRFFSFRFTVGHLEVLYKLTQVFMGHLTSLVFS